MDIDMSLFMLILLSAMSPRASAESPREQQAHSETAPGPRSTLDAILAAIRSTESGGRAQEGRDAIGDGGRALGPYQIHRAYFVDSGVEGRYEQCRDEGFSRVVVIAYWKRWCPEALEQRDAEVLARIHNGGPNGARKDNTLTYWRRVERRLAATSSAVAPRAER
jgi:Destabilase